MRRSPATSSVALLSDPDSPAPEPLPEAVETPRIPIIGDAVWYWQRQDLLGTNEYRYVIPRAAIVTHAFRRASDASLSLAVLGLGHYVEAKNIQAADEPRDNCWTWPIEDWELGMVRISDGLIVPIRNPDLPAHLTFVGQDVIYGAGIYANTGDFDRTLGVFPMLAKVVEAKSFQHMDLEISSINQDLPSRVSRTPKGVRMAFGELACCWPVPKDPHGLLLATMGTYSEPSAKPRPAQVSEASRPGYVNLHLFDLYFTFKRAKMISRIPVSDEPKEGHWTPGPYALKAMRLLEGRTK